MRKISLVADTSALVSPASVSLLSLVLSEFDVVVTGIVVSELKAMSTFDDAHGRAATEVLEKIETIGGCECIRLSEIHDEQNRFRRSILP